MRNSLDRRCDCGHLTAASAGSDEGRRAGEAREWASRAEPGRAWPGGNKRLR